MVSNPYLGIEEWFEPDREVMVLARTADAVPTYRELCASPALRAELGARARTRLLSQHTYGHRARQLMDTLRSRAASDTY